MSLGLNSINWENTNNNILGQLLLCAKIDDYADFVCLSRNRMYEIFSKRNPTVDELSLYSKILGVPMDELIVYESDNYNPYDIEELKQLSKEMADSSKKERIEEISGRIRLNRSGYDSLKIRSLEEFLLYLPLMLPSSLSEFLIRIGGDLTPDYNAYKSKQLNRLYDKIPLSPAKEYADWWRDTYIRTKGDRDKCFTDKRNEKEHLLEAYQALARSDYFQKEFNREICDERSFAIQLYEEAYNKSVEEQNKVPFTGESA